MPFCTSCGSPVDAMVERCSNCSVQPPPPVVTYFRCTAEGLPLLLLYLKTILLSIVTLGVYSFWGRAEIRRYLAEHVWAGDDRFAWHGTGLELFLGWVKAFGILLLIYTAFFIASLSPSEAVRLIATVVLFLGLSALLPFVIVASLRYRLSRTSLRGIRFSSTAGYGDFAVLYYKGLLLTIVTLGLYSPWFGNDTLGYLTRHTHWGDQHFDFDGEGKDMFGPYVIFLLLLFPTFYLISFWFLAKRQRYYWGRTIFGPCRFSCTLTGMDLFVVMLINGLTVLFTLGIAYPWAVIRNLELQCRTVQLYGAVPFTQIRQRAAAATATGEGAATLLDVETDVGGGFGL